jgi:hypothetical protein
MKSIGERKESLHPKAPIDMKEGRQKRKVSNKKRQLVKSIDERKENIPELSIGMTKSCQHPRASIAIIEKRHLVQSVD